MGAPLIRLQELPHARGVRAPHQAGARGEENQTAPVSTFSSSCGPTLPSPRRSVSCTGTPMTGLPHAAGLPLYPKASSYPLLCRRCPPVSAGGARFRAIDGPRGGRAENAVPVRATHYPHPDHPSGLPPGSTAASSVVGTSALECTRSAQCQWMKFFTFTPSSAIQLPQPAVPAAALN